TVESEISKYTYLPSLLELERSVSHLLTDPTPYRRNQVNAYLEGLNRRAGSWEKARLEAFVSDENGIIILSSNPALRLKAVRSLSADDKERLARSMQYYW
ncbi:sensor histidine kinase, partial [Escherichia coli]|uniref:hypothetical protein n=1 Tax=Escherichia coli TaxID=562 RepID=UPI000FF20812